MNQGRHHLHRSSAGAGAARELQQSPGGFASNHRSSDCDRLLPLVFRTQHSLSVSLEQHIPDDDRRLLPSLKELDGELVSLLSVSDMADLLGPDSSMGQRLRILSLVRQLQYEPDPTPADFLLAFGGSNGSMCLRMLTGGRENHGTRKDVNWWEGESWNSWLGRGGWEQMSRRVEM